MLKNTVICSINNKKIFIIVTYWFGGSMKLMFNLYGMLSKKKFSLAELSAKAGVSRMTLYRHLRQNTIPKKGDLEKILGVLQCDITDIIGTVETGIFIPMLNKTNVNVNIWMRSSQSKAPDGHEFGHSSFSANDCKAMMNFALYLSKYNINVEIEEIRENPKPNIYKIMKRINSDNEHHIIIGSPRINDLSTSLLCYWYDLDKNKTFYDEKFRFAFSFNNTNEINPLIIPTSYGNRKFGIYERAGKDVNLVAEYSYFINRKAKDASMIVVKKNKNRLILLCMGVSSIGSLAAANFLVNPESSVLDTEKWIEDGIIILSNKYDRPDNTLYDNREIVPGTTKIEREIWS